MDLIIIWAIAVITIAILTLICYRKAIIHEYKGIIYSLCHATSSSDNHIKKKRLFDILYWIGIGLIIIINISMNIYCLFN